MLNAVERARSAAGTHSCLPLASVLERPQTQVAVCRRCDRDNFRVPCAPTERAASPDPARGTARDGWRRRERVFGQLCEAGGGAACTHRGRGHMIAPLGGRCVGVARGHDARGSRRHRRGRLALGIVNSSKLAQTPATVESG